MATKYRKKSRGPERLEDRALLAGDLISLWLADDFVEAADTAQWTDQIVGLAVDAVGNPQATPDRFGGRATVRFDPTDDVDFFRMKPNDNPLPSGDFSIAIAFASSAPIQGEGRDWFTNTGLVDANTLGIGADWGVSLAPDGRISAGVGAGFLQSTTLYSEQAGLNDGNLHTVFFTRSEGNLSIYVNDALSGSRDDGSTDPRSQRDITFGLLQNDQNPFNGEIGQIRFYDGALTADEVQTESSAIRAYYNNAPPTARDDIYTFPEDTLLYLANSDAGVLANDEDVDGDPLVAELVSSTAQGALTLNADGSFAYSAPRDFFGTEQFTYRVRNGQVSNVATVTLVVENVYDAVDVQNDLYKLRPTEVLRVDAAQGVLTNDNNIDQVALTVELVEAPASGVLDLRPDGSFDYDPAGFAGRTSFRYQVNDGVGQSAPAQVELIVNTPPRALPDLFRGTEDQTLTISSLDGVLQNDQDAENDPLTASVLAEPQHGSLTLNPDGSFEYVPDPNFHGTDTFFYTVSDSIDDSGLAAASIVIEPVNDPPVANDNLYFVPQGETLVVADAASGVLNDDTDIEQSTALTAAVVDTPANGTVQLAEDGTFTYRPNGAFQGVDSFTYRASDGLAQSQLATVEIYVDIAPVRISEVMVANVDQLITNLRDEPDDRFRSRDEFAPDWIEIENRAETDFDLGGFYLSDNEDNPIKWQVPTGTVIPAGGYGLVFASGRDITNVLLDENSTPHTNFNLNIRNEEVILAFPDGRIADQIEPRIHPPNTSFGIDANGVLGFLTSATPGAENVAGTLTRLQPVDFSVSRGMYDSPFDVELTTDDANVAIQFTTDGSPPSPTNGQAYQGPIRIDSTTTLRAAAFAPDRISGDIMTHTYLFLDDVIVQAELPSDYPSSWAGMAASYGMDPDVVGEQNLFEDRYRNSIFDDLKSLPSMSLVFERDDFFGEEGIYQNPLGTGDNWERSTSVEFFDPLDGESGFHINSGVRVMGGSSRQPDIPKHSLRLEFREAYGWGSLDYPMFENVAFGEGATDSFDELVIRTGFNNSWMHRHYYQGERGEQPRDQWVRDLSAAMGQPAARGRYIHVYLNGMYWGIYNIQERPAAPYMEEYFGGNADTDWTVMNSGQPIDGSSASWTALHRLARDADEPAVYEQLREDVDLVNLADYMLLNFYVGNTDWDGQNWISAGSVDQPYRMFAWDSEFAISLPPSNTAIGENAENQIINVNRTNQNATNSPSGLHRLLLRSDEYRMLFADRIQKHMFNAGVLTPEVSTEFFLQRSAEVDRAVVAESARWGDFRRDVNPGRWRSDQFDLFTRDEHFLAQKEFIVDRYLPVRTGIVLDQLRRGNQFPDVDAPVLSQHGGRVAKGYQLTVLDSIENAEIYYTLNGLDPRNEGGTLNPDAIRYSGPIVVGENVTIKMRRRLTDEWSALTEATFQASTPASADSLRISEVHYHPTDPTNEELLAGIDDADEFEFIELVNISTEVIDLTDVRLVRELVDGDEQGVDFRFANGSIDQLSPNQRLVVVESVDAFGIRYGEGIAVAGQWSGGLSNGGERIKLVAGEEIIHQFTYDDQWQPTTDGSGPSLERIDVTASDLSTWGQASAWRASFADGGSPGGLDRIPGDVNGDGIFNSSDLTLVFQVGEYEDEIEDNSTFEEGDWDGDGDFNTRDLVLVFELGLFSKSARPVLLDAPTDAPSLFSQPGESLLISAREADALFREDEKRMWLELES